ncbi:ArsR/SmtB family transcription factor [Catelliglobosispora koreensis]|uniref:ArsR/SmtB family transcription factor n=1 Tax=Catelliglobosispora koreensis TaxID=129052 RepID=UPI000374E17D|nr:helix-turn-helix domain-containing protein [Catelliglobosispora koreensis]
MSREVRLTAASLRGLAHPLRVRILGLLRANGPATSTTLALALGQSTGTTSYHLRQLAAHGFIVDDEELGAGRERWWKAAHQRTTFDTSDLPDIDPADVVAYMRAVAASYADNVDRWLNETYTGPWRDVGTLSDWRLKLTRAETEELQAAIFELASRYRRYDAEEAPEDAQPVSLQVQVMPFVQEAE